MSRPIEAWLSRRAIAANVAVAKRAAPASRVWAVLKADAYGHGLSRVAGGDSPALANADGVAILDIEAAALLRELGWTRPILLLEGCFDAGDLDQAMRLGVTVTVHHDEQIAMIEAARAKQLFSVYLKINTGMNRLGFAPSTVHSAHRRLQATGNVGALTWTTHFANSDRADGIDEQVASFDRGVDGLPGPQSLANSAAVLLHPSTHRDWVRPGVLIYGATPFAKRSAAEFGLVPAMTLRSRLIAVQQLKPGDRVGYGHRYVAEREMRIGVVACGYADGYPRVAPSDTPIAVDRVRTTLAGRVSMDMLTVDLTPVPQAQVGSEVELWGATIPVDEVAQAANTVGYELLCAVAPRVPFKIID